MLAARGVTAKDSGGTSDVYCQVFLDKEKILKTEVLKKTVDPVFENEKGKLLYVSLLCLDVQLTICTGILATATRRFAWW